jgi:O-antigen/teichoic acid export membrane protein
MNVRSFLNIQDSSDNKKVKHFFQQLTLFSGGNSLAQLVMMVYAIIIARALGIVGLGVYSGIYAFLGVTITFVNFGMDTWMLKVSDIEQPTNGLTGKVVSSKLIAGLLWLLLCNLILPVLNKKEFLPIYVALASLDVLTDVTFNTILVHFNIVKEIHRYNIFLLSSRIGKLAALFLLLYLNQATLLYIIISRLVISILIFGISFYFAKPTLPKAAVVEQLKKVHFLRKTSVVFGLSEILAMVYANADVAILALFSTSQAGLYSPASGIIHALFILPNSFYNYLLPMMSKREHMVDSETKKVDASRIIFLFGVLGVLLTLFVVLLSAFLLVPLLGKNYLMSKELLIILSPIMFFKSLSFGLATLLVARSLQSKRLIPQIIVAVFDVFLVVLLIPRFGAIGVAWTYVIAELLLSIGYWLILVRPNAKVKHASM